MCCRPAPVLIKIEIFALLRGFATTHVKDRHGFLNRRQASYPTAHLGRQELTAAYDPVDCDSVARNFNAAYSLVFRRMCCAGVFKCIYDVSMTCLKRTDNRHYAKAPRCAGNSMPPDYALTYSVLDIIWQSSYTRYLSR